MKGVRALIDEVKEETYYYIPREYEGDLLPILEPLLA